MKTCPNCGNDIPEDADFCKFCGNKYLNCPSDGFRTTSYEIVEHSNTCPEEDGGCGAALLVVVEVIEYSEGGETRYRPVFVWITWHPETSPTNMHCPGCGVQSPISTLINAGGCLSCYQRLHISVLSSSEKPDVLKISYKPGRLMEASSGFKLLMNQSDYETDSNS